MIKLFSRRPWLALIFSMMAGSGIILACAGDWGPGYGTSNFSPELFVDSAYSPFFYSDMFYYGIGHDDGHDTRFNADNVKAWSAYFGDQYASSELTTLLQNTSLAAVDSLAGWLNGKISSVPESCKGLQMLADRKNKKLGSFIYYLALAKKSEAFAVNDYATNWDYDAKKKVPLPFAAADFIKALNAGFQQEQNLFLKERYWFQLERAYFFQGSAKEAGDFFEKTERQFEHNTMYYRTQAYAAGAYYKLKNFSRANYYYSLVYDGSDLLKLVAHYSFHPQNEADWQATLALAKNNREKATLWQMLGIFYSDPRRAIGEIYKLDPRSDKLDLLLARAVNEAEQGFAGETPYDGQKAVKNRTDSSSRNLLALVHPVADAGNTAKPWVWNMAAGYLAMLAGNNQAATEYYNRAQKALPSEKLAQAQLRLLKFLNKVSAAKHISAKDENEWLPDLVWLSNMTDSTIPNFRYADGFNWINKTISALYIRQNEILKAECFQPLNQFYSDDSKLVAMKAFLGKKNPTPFEAYCIKFSTVQWNDIAVYQGIRLSYEDSLDKALVHLQESGPQGNDTLAGNPFNARIQDCHDCDHAATQKVKYSKLSFIKKLKEIQDRLNAGDSIYQNALLLGNAFYNMSHFGNARLFYECKIIGSGQSDPSFIEKPYRKMLTAMDRSNFFYGVALKNAGNNEQRAKIQYLLAKCERNEWYTHRFTDSDQAFDPYDRAKPDFIAWKAFQELKNYSTTQYYREVLKECGYFSTFVRHPAKK